MLTASRSDFQLPPELSPLCAIPHWIGWQRITRGDRITKPPTSLIDGRIIDIRDQGEWMPYRYALRLVDDVDVAGLGFVLLDSNIAALDLDDAIHKGVMEPWARRLIDRTCSYVERTPSGHGLRILGFGHGRPVHSSWRIGDGKLEVYRRATRFITVTGAQIDGAELVDIDRLIDDLIEEHTPRAENSAPKRAPIEIDDLDDDGDWEEIINAVQCAGPCTRSRTNERNRGCKDLRKLVRTTIQNGSRSDVIWKTGKILKEHGCSPDQVATVLLVSHAFEDKHGSSLTALAGEVERIFAK